MPPGLGRARAAIDVEQVLEASVGADARCKDTAVLARAVLRLRLEHDRARAVAEQHAGGAVRPIENARERLRTNDNGALELARLEEIVSDRHRVDKARAHGLHVECRAFRHAERVLNGDRGRRKGAIRRRGRADHQIDVDGVDGRAHQGLLCRGDTEIRRALAFIRDVALADARPLDDPFVAGIDELCQVRIGHHALWQMRANATDDGADDCQRRVLFLFDLVVCDGWVTEPAAAAAPDPNRQLAVIASSL